MFPVSYRNTDVSIGIDHKPYSKKLGGVSEQASEQGCTQEIVSTSEL